MAGVRSAHPVSSHLPSSTRAARDARLA